MNLKNLITKQDLKRIIIEELGYPATGDQPFPIQVDEDIKSKISSSNIIATYKGFNVVFMKFNPDDKHQNRFDLSMRGLERTIISKTDKHLCQQYLFIFSSSDGEYWHFVNARSSGSKLEIKRFSITPFNRDRLRTTSERLALIRVESGDDLQSIIEKHKKSFDVEEVTMEFFHIFANKFLELIELMKSNRIYLGDQKKISDTAQIILNRLVFLKFIEQKKWLASNPNYLYEKFQPYYTESGSYWHEIVTPLFELLSDKERKKYRELGNIPFLNGGLFGKEPKDLFLIPIPNSFFQDLFNNLLNRFNFTIEESSPSSVEVAVDPEMLGRIFEELVLRLEKAIDKPEAEFQRELRRETGSYYTPRVAVYFMAQEAIARRLADLSGIDQQKIKKLIDLATDEYNDSDQLSKIELSTTECQSILGQAEKITICDPAVGSGAFLLGSLQILVGIKRFLMLKLEDKRAQDINFNYTLKEQSIKQNLIGVDILRQAVHICELRLWLSLAVDYQRHPGDEIPTLPNLTYKVFQGDSIVDYLAGKMLQSNEGRFRLDNFSANESIRQKLNKIKALKDGYFSETDENRKKKLEEQIAEDRMRVAIEILEFETPMIEQINFLGEVEKLNVKKVIQKMENDSRHELIANLKRLLATNNFSDLFISNDKLSFVWMIDLVEYFIDHGQTGFDIVIGNPPYGIKNEVMNKGRVRYGLGNDDSYGVFTAMAFQDLLKTGGIISFITSDTWQTIKTHKPLRRFLLDNSFIHYLLMMPQWLFGATVNTSVLIATKSERGNAKEKQGDRVIFENSYEREKNELIACDFTRAEEKTGELEEYLYSLDNPEYVSTPKRAIYHYQQGLIETNSNWPFFVSSPMIFSEINKKIRNNEYSNLGNLIEGIFGGIKSYNNKKYIRSTNGEEGYEIVESQLISTRELTDTEKSLGINIKQRSKPYYLEFEKGGKTLKSNGCFNNYYYPVRFFFPWDTDTVNKLSKINALRNKELYFSKGIGVTAAGIYSPLFRDVKLQLFQNGFQVMVLKKDIDKSLLLGILCSKFIRYVFKNFVNHTVNSNAQDIIDLPIAEGQEYKTKINNLTDLIIEKLKKDSEYNFEKEQKEIDNLVYKMYGLGENDRMEVETWYTRRYPSLA